MILSKLTQILPRRGGGPRETSSGGPEEPKRQRFTPASGLASAATSGVASEPGPVASVPLPEAPSLPVRTAPIAGPVFTGDKPILEQFASDIAAAPEIVGELTALYVEQHRHLAIRFVSRALSLRPDAAEDILAAAHRREVHGLDWLSGLMIGAVMLVMAPHIAEAAPLAHAILDIVDIGLPLDPDALLDGAFAPVVPSRFLSPDDVLSDGDGALPELAELPVMAVLPTAPLPFLWETLLPVGGS